VKKFIIASLLSFPAFIYAQTSQGAWGLYDYERAEYQIVFNRSEVRSIASITKLFTANTILRAGLDLNEKVKVQGKSGGRFPRGTMVTRMNLMKAMLISSDNLAAETLANTYPGGFSQFLDDTNRWVKGFGLVDTTIVDASGLLAGNQSSTDNLVLFLYRIKDNSVIRSISAEVQTTLKLPKGKKTITIHLKNTNPVLFQFDNVLISKTGTTSAAGRCVIMLVEKNNSLHAVIVLGQKTGQDRNKIAEFLVTILPINKVYAHPQDGDIVSMELPL
jgi:D-alanyl-D-alanine carboxypeptidase